MSTRAVVNTSAWESSGANSRRSSSVGPPQTQTAASTSNQHQQGARIGQHLSRLHKKAQEHLHDGRQSVMSECAMAPNHDPSSSSTLSGYASRRASDPVRVQQRTTPGMTRHRSGSYNGHQQNQQAYQVKSIFCKNMLRKNEGPKFCKDSPPLFSFD